MNKVFLCISLILTCARVASSQVSDLAIGLPAEKKPAKVTASLVSEVKTAAPGQAFRVAVKLVHAPQHHTYGKELPPEVIGKPTSLQWTLPEGWKLEDLPWPPTHQTPSTDGKMSEGYDGTVYLPAKITPAGAAGSSGEILVKVDALVCDPKSCMPFKAEAKLSVAVAATAEPDPATADVFGKTGAASAPEVSPQASVAPNASASKASATPSPAASATPKTAEHSFAVYLIFAFVGGLILNVMPCVFPVLGIKVMGVVQQAGGDKKQIVAHSLAYTSGVLLSFWLLGGLVVALGKGWGFQLQSAGFVYSLSVFFLVFALNMAGVFEIGASAVGVGTELQSKQGMGGSFFSGLLATVVATPCSAPILGSALGATVALPPVQAMSIFTLIGLGLASPFLVLAYAPKLVSALPRPGAWMESFKQGMSFLLFGTVAYLAWVLTGMIEGQPLLFTLMSLVIVAVGCWIYGRWSLPHKAARTRLAAVLLALAFGFGGMVYGWPHKQAAPKIDPNAKMLEGSLVWEVWSPSKVAALREAGTPVYIDFTAKWCFTCQVNKRVYHDAGLQALFQKKKVTLLKADWTNENDEIKQALAALGKAAVPVNVLYIPGQNEPFILPELLSVQNVTEALNKLP